MTDRSVSGNISRSVYKQAQKLADELGLTPEAMDLIADGVREFDAHQSSEGKSARALEQIAKNTTPQRERQDSWGWEEQRLRRREVYAQELMAVAIFEDDVSSETMDTIRASRRFEALLGRLTADTPVTGPDASPAS